MRGEDGLYCNDGDWVEHCSALVETTDGELQLLQWSDQPVIVMTEQDAPAVAGPEGDRPVVDVLTPSFIEQVNRIAG